MNQQITKESLEEFNKFLKTKVETFEDIFENSIDAKKISYQTSELGTDWTYAMMHLVAQRVLLEIRQNFEGSKLLDVASQFSFISFAASFYEVVYIEARNTSTQISCENVCKLTGVSCEAQNMPFDNESFDVITSLHAIEHFGLGRYGDTLDYHGDQKGLIEFGRVLKNGGHMVLGVPAAVKSKIEYNSQRVYKPEDFDKLVESKGLKKVNGFVVYPPGSRRDGLTVGRTESLNEWPQHYTPPVYLSVFKK